MTFSYILALLAIGLVAGLVSGLMGVGGAIIIVPALVFFMKFNQLDAQGTSLTLLLAPVGIFAVINYYKQGHVDLKVALVLMAAFVIGGYFGSKLSLQLPDQIVRKIFGGLILLVAIKMILGK